MGFPSTVREFHDPSLLRVNTSPSFVATLTVADALAANTRERQAASDSAAKPKDLSQCELLILMYPPFVEKWMLVVPTDGRHDQAWNAQ
jgi:hypothetical protein